VKGVTTMKRVALAFVLTLSAFSIAAFDFSGSGFTQVGVSPTDSKTVILVDKAGGQLLFDVEVDPSAGRLAALRSLVAEIHSWKNVTIAELRAVNSTDRLQVTLIPNTFAVGGVDLQAAVPEGIQLFSDTATEYDFKILSGNTVLRVRSVYTSEDDLDAAALAAYKDPSSFLAARDPLYVQKRLNDASSRLAALEGQNAGDKKALADLATIKEQDAERDAQWVRTRMAILAALNGSKPVDAVAASKLDDLKKANPQLTKADAAKALKDAGVSLKSAEISAIFLVDFGEP